jgi:hypothetical protein
MHPVKNPTKYALENLEHQLVDSITETLYSVLDNGDRPDKRIDAIIGLHQARIGIARMIHKIAHPIVDAP